MKYRQGSKVPGQPDQKGCRAVAPPEGIAQCGDQLAKQSLGRAGWALETFPPRVSGWQLAVSSTVAARGRSCRAAEGRCAQHRLSTGAIQPRSPAVTPG